MSHRKNESVCFMKKWANLMATSTLMRIWKLKAPKIKEGSILITGKRMIKTIANNIFAGIKLYPPLGFEPWPNNSEELTKVELLYDTCIKQNIPVIPHCSTGGFLVESNYKAFSDPSKQWAFGI